MIMPTVKTRIFALGCLFELASAPVVQTVAQNGQYIYDVQDGEADIFGQLRYEKNVNGTGLVKLNTANPNGYKWVSDYGYQAGVTPITTAGTINVVAKVELAGDTYPADNVLATPLEVKISAADADKWLTLNTDNSWGWRFPFFMLDPYSQCQALFLEKEMQKKGIEITGMRFLYNGKNAEAYTFPARIGIKNTTRTDMLDEDGGNAMFDEDGFTTVFDGNITIQGNANDLELVVNLDKPYKYEGGNVIMKFECPLGKQYIKDSMKHPDWHMMEMDGNPHIAYCSGEDEDANVWGELLMPFISIAYKDNGSTGIFAIGGDKNGVTRSGDSLLFDECADEARLYSATGALVASAQRANALSVAGLAKGIYVLKLTKGGAVRSLKVEF